jgi:hypothetical protein
MDNEPYLEPFLLWGAFPLKAQKINFLQAQPSKVNSPYQYRVILRIHLYRLPLGRTIFTDDWSKNS